MKARGLLFAGIAVAAALAAGPAAGQEKKDPFDKAPRIAVFNLKDCYEPEKYDRVALVKKQMDGEANALKAELETLQKRLRDIQEKMDGIPDKTRPLYQKFFQEGKMTEYQLKMTKEMGQMNLVNKIAGIQTEIYQDIVKACEAIATAHKLDLIIRLEEPKLDEEETMQSYLRRINQRVVFFRNPDLDVTKEVLAHLNAEWKKVAPPPSPSPTGSPTPSPSPGPTPGK